MKPELTLLKEEQIWGSKQLEVIKKCGTKVAITDLAILTGGYVSIDFHVDEDSTLSGRTGWIWTSSDDKLGDVCAVDYYGNNERSKYMFKRRLCVCPALQSSAILNNISPNIVRGINGVEEIELGEYPQMAADVNMQQILEREYKNGSVRKTGKDYTFDSRLYNDYDNGINPVIYDEYEYQGKKYIRIKANTYDGTEQLSNGMEVKRGDYVWVEVEPVVFRIDRKAGMLISKKGLVSGIRYHDSKTDYEGDFKKTEMYTYMNTYMVKDIFQSAQLVNTQNLTPEEKTEEDEVSKLINKIKKLIEPMEDSKEQEIINRVNQLIEKYNMSIANRKTDISFDNPLSLETVSFESLKNELIMGLNSIIQSLYENEKLLNILDEIKHYRDMMKQDMDIPVSILNNADKIIYMIAVSRTCQQPKIIQELDRLFEQISSKISTALSQSCEQEIRLTLENKQNVQTLFARMIQNMFTAVNRYYIIQMSLRGIGENELAKEFLKLYQLIQTLDDSQQKEYDSELTKIRDEFSLDVCMNNDIEKLLLAIRTRMQPIAREIKFYGGAIAEVKRKILELLENPNIEEAVREKTKQELTKVMEEWAIRLKNNEEVINTNPTYQHLNDDAIRQLQCLKELYNIQYNIEQHLTNLSKYGQTIKGI